MPTASLEIRDWLTAAAVAAVCALMGMLAGLDPALGLGASLALAFTGIALANLTAGLLIFTILSFLEFSLPAGELTFTKAAGFLLALSCLAKLAVGRRERNLLADHPLAAYALIAFLAWGAVSMIWAESSSEAVSDLSRYVLVFGLVVITYTAVRTRGHATAAFAVFILGCALTAAYALVFRPTTALDAFRVQSTVGNPNVLASILVAGLVLSLGALFAYRRVLAARIGAALTAALCIVALFDTGSRSGAIALAVALVVSILVAGRWRLQTAIAGTLLAVVISVGFMAYAPEYLRDRLVSTLPGEERTADGRVTLWQVGVEMASDHPVQGVGVGNFQAVSGDYAFDPGVAPRTEFVIDNPQVAHNVYLQILAELGIVGLALFLGILGFSVGCAWRAAQLFERTGDLAMEIMSRALIPAVVSMLASNFFASEQFNKLLWLLLALGPAVYAIARAGAMRRPTELELARPG